MVIISLGWWQDPRTRIPNTPNALCWGRLEREIMVLQMNGNRRARKYSMAKTNEVNANNDGQDDKQGDGAVQTEHRCIELYR